MEDTYYTLQITLSRPVNGQATHEFKDIQKKDIEVMKQRIWTTGLKIQLTESSFELISPFMIEQAIMIKQDKKFSI